MQAASEYYQDTVAVVTGGASGIGLALAETMLSYGANQVVLADFNDENLQRETARLNTAHAGKVLGMHCDVTKEEDVQGMIRKSAEFGGRIDILFNNAGAGLGAALELAGGLSCCLIMSTAVVQSTECPFRQAAWPRAIDRCVLPTPV
jgi:NAD(P)-dependent dehydrogenase (short-subunit alcohol dehydrogenase family)